LQLLFKWHLTPGVFGSSKSIYTLSIANLASF
jgi:hypothetical protein